MEMNVKGAFYLDVDTVRKTSAVPANRPHGGRGVRLRAERIRAEGTAVAVRRP